MKAAMTDPETKQMAEFLVKIELTLAQVLDAQREHNQSERDWFAADIRLREEQLTLQQALLQNSRAAQRKSTRNVLVMGMLAGAMLLLGLGLLTEPWWMPVVSGGR